MADLFSQQLLHNVQQLREQNQTLNRIVGAQGQKIAELTGIEKVLGSLKMSRSGGGVSGLGGADDVPGARNAPMVKMPNGMGYQSLDQIVGRQIVYDMLCTIPVIDGQPGPVRNTMYVSPDGPFCAVARYMMFLSTHSVQYTSSSGVSAFYSRSNGRFRPVSSSSDIMDAVRAFDQPNQYQPAYIGAIANGDGEAVPVANPIGVNPSSTDVINMLPNWPGNGRPIYASPFSMAAQRTMSFDGLVSIETRASATRRQEQPVPSTMWTDQNGGMVRLPTIDVFEPGEIIDVVVEPTHPNNPAYGNIQELFYFNTGAGYDAFDPATGQAANNPAPRGNFPSLAGQFDGHEGTDASSLPGSTAETTDPASRNASGLLVVGYLGYRILQGPSALR